MVGLVKPIRLIELVGLVGLVSSKLGKKQRNPVKKCPDIQ